MDAYYAQWRGPVKQWCVIGSNGIVMGEGIPAEAEADRIVAERNAQAGDTLEGLRARVAELEAENIELCDALVATVRERDALEARCAALAMQTAPPPPDSRRPRG